MSLNVTKGMYLDFFSLALLRPLIKLLCRRSPMSLAVTNTSDIYYCTHTFFLRVLKIII